MRNYEYIIASLPIVDQNFSLETENLIEEISQSLDICDRKILDFFLSAFSKETELDLDFYKKALSHSNAFIRKYFAFDLELRNLKVKYLNNRLSRQSDKDLVILNKDAESEETEYTSAIQNVLEGKDILSREKGLDNLYWKFIDETTLWDYFNLNLILGFVAKIKIIDRWNKLDSQTGRELFRKLVEQIRSTYDNKKTTL